MARRKQIIRYGISLGIDTTDMARGAREANTVTRRLNRDMGRTESTLRKYKHAQMQLRHEFKAGLITKEQYLRQLKKERLLRDRANGSLDKYRMKQRQEAEARRKETMELRRQEVAMRRLAAQREREARAMAAARARHSQMMGGAGAGALSMFGLGGQYAGGARMAGNLGADEMFAGMGTHLAAGAAGAMGMIGMGRYLNNAIDKFGELEGKLVDLKVLYGEIKGEKLGKEFKQLANSTALTTSQLIGNAKIWASYGLTTDGIVDRMRRLGEVTGGNTEKFQALTVAFAQVNAQGKLMGQEKNQLINAGFSLAEIAKVAGIEMTDFAKAMEEGRITADHLNQALVNMTEEGGLYFGLLEEKAKTLEGQTIITASKWEEASQAVGENSRYMREGWLGASKALAEYIKQQEEWAASTSKSGAFGFGQGGMYNKFGMGGTMKGSRMGGSYRAEGFLKSSPFSARMTAGADSTSLFQELVMGMMGMSGAAQSGLEADLIRSKMVSGLPEEILKGTKGGWQELRDPAKQKAEFEAAKKKREEQEAKDKVQYGNYQQQMERFMFVDSEKTGYRKIDEDRALYEIDKAFKAGEYNVRQHGIIYKKTIEYFEMLKRNDSKVEKQKEADMAAKAAEDRAKKVGGFMQYGQYENQGLTPDAIALLKKRDKMLAESQSTLGGKGGGVNVGTTGDYALAAERKKEIADRARAIDLAEKQERHQAQIRANTNTQIQQMNEQNRFLAENIGGV